MSVSRHSSSRGATLDRDHQTKSGLSFEAAKNLAPRSAGTMARLSISCGNCHVIKHHIAHRRFGQRLGDDEKRHAGRMVRPLDEGQPGDDLGRSGPNEAAPPWSRA